MKQCPQCGTDYNDSINFCRKDGRSLIAKVTTRTRLCPHCANSITEDAERCPYCKAEVGSVSTPQWPQREEPPPLAARSNPPKPGAPRAAKAILVTGIVLCAIGLFLVGAHLFGRNDRGQLQALLEAKIKEVEERDQKIQSLENQRAQVRQATRDDRNAQVRPGTGDNPKELTALKAKLEESQKELSTTQQRLSNATRELSENASERAALRAKLEQSQKELAALQVRLDIATRELNRTAARSQPSTTIPQKTAEPSQKTTEASQKTVEPSQKTREPSQKTAEPSPAAQARRAAEPGTYQTTRSTDVHEEASASSPVIARIGKGTTLTVIRSVGDWLEVRSKHGKPPGFIRRDDAIYMSSAN